MKRKSWFDIGAKESNAKQIEIWVYDELGAFGIHADRFIEAVKAKGEVDEIALHINSIGGDPFAAAAMYLFLKRHPAKITAYNDGLAASAASVLLMVGDHIVMPANTMLMIHDPVGGVFGTADDMRDFAEAMDKIKQTILTAYRRSGKSDEELSEIMSAETWYTASEALANHFIDEISSEIQVAARGDLSRFKNLPAALLTPQPDPQPNAVDRSDLLSTLPPAAKKAIQSARKLADEERERAQAIAKACADTGRPDLTLFFLDKDYSVEAIRKYLTDPVRLAEVTAFRQSDEVKEIYEICASAHVPEMAADFIGEGKSVEQVRHRLQHAGAINERCAAFAHRFGTGFDMRERAREFIKAGAKPDEVSNMLLRLLAAMDPGEIDNKLGPDVVLGRSPRQTAVINYAEIYAKRRPKAQPTLGELKALFEYVR